MENSYRFFENKQCQYYPCHQGVEHLNCLFCYCPLYNMKNCPGKHEYIEAGGKLVKSCMDCTFPHRPEKYDVIIKLLSYQTTK